MKARGPSIVKYKPKSVRIKQEHIAWIELVWWPQTHTLSKKCITALQPVSLYFLLLAARNVSSIYFENNSIVFQYKSRDSKSPQSLHSVFEKFFLYRPSKPYFSKTLQQRGPTTDRLY